MEEKRYLFIFLLFATAIVLSACSSEPSVTISTGINVHKANEIIVENKDVIVLDVRTPKEFVKGHISGAININIHDPTFSQQVAALDREKLYIIHCAVNPRGGRGDKSIHIMNQLGFSNLLSLDGGLNAWKRANLPIRNT
ncbi:MAG: rhodanese-like domain-containing protein [Gammaproteobacteria bacterium]|nr:rhodanese-like domain-containing protein [Gammaproteobacteria bacterium]